MTLNFSDTPIYLLPGRAAFLPEHQVLVVADVHLGKSATFRQLGLPIPEGDTQADLSRLDHLMLTSGAQSLVVAGDLFHSSEGLTLPFLEELESWFSSRSFPVTLVEGNHDQRASRAISGLTLRICPALRFGNLDVCHDPADLSSGQPGLCGHLHPGVRLGAGLRVPGFFLKNGEHLILPAFSEFTGIHPVAVTRREKFFTELRDRIVEIPASQCQALAR